MKKQHLGQNLRALERKICGFQSRAAVGSAIDIAQSEICCADLVALLLKDRDPRGVLIHRLETFETARMIEPAAAAGPKIAVTTGMIALCNSAFWSEMVCSVSSLNVDLPSDLLHYAVESIEPRDRVRIPGRRLVRRELAEQQAIADCRANRLRYGVTELRHLRGDCHGLRDGSEGRRRLLSAAPLVGADGQIETFDIRDNFCHDSLPP